RQRRPALSGRRPRRPGLPGDPAVRLPDPDPAADDAGPRQPLPPSPDRRRPDDLRSLSMSETVQPGLRTVLSGLRPTGRVHLGNYFGAVKNWVDLQDSGKYRCFFFVADLHAL